MKKMFLWITKLIAALISAVLRILDISELLFLIGAGALFRGLVGVWSIDGAFVVVGALFVIVGLWGARTARHDDGMAV